MIVLLEELLDQNIHACQYLSTVIKYYYSQGKYNVLLPPNHLPSIMAIACKRRAVILGYLVILFRKIVFT